MKRRSLVLASITKLKQICNHPLNATGEDGRIAGRSGKLARFDELVDELLDVGERALVFTQYVTMGNLLARHVAARFGWTVPFLSGSTATDPPGRAGRRRSRPAAGRHSCSCR